MTAPIQFTVFTKPWSYELPRLGEFIAGLGFDGIELPVRPGYPVTPDNVETALPNAARTLAQYGITIASIAGPTDERTIAACAEAGVPVIRVCIAIPKGHSYLDAEADVQRTFDRLVPALDRAGVTIGVQNHCDRFVANAMGIRHLIGRFDRKHVAAVLDYAHCALAGELPDLATDIAWSHLCMVNLKNAFWERTSPPNEVAHYRHVWVGGREGLCPWPDVVGVLQQRQYQGVVCLTAEYSDHAAVDHLIREDLAFARSLFAMSSQ